MAELQTAMAERDTRTPGPLVLDANAADNWRKFLMQFEIYLVAKSKDDKPDKLKVNMLLHCAGPEAIEEYSHFVYNAGEDKECYADVCSKFKALCEGARNVIYERLVFNKRNQKEGERVDNFVSELKRLSLTCEFGELRDSLIRDRIVGGVLSDELRGELLKKPDLTLQKAHDYCRTFEASELQKFKFNIQASAGTEHSLGIQPVRKSKEADKTAARSCKFCGYKHPFTRPSRCPAFGKQCLKCKKEGHFAQVCPGNVKEGSKVDLVQQESPPDLDTQNMNKEVHTYFGSIELDSVSDSRKSTKSLITLKIEGQNVEVKADTGAEATVIPFHLYKKISKKPLQKIQQPLKGWLATKPIHPRGCVRLQTQYKNRQMNLLYLVVDGNFTPLLGCDACLDLEVLQFMNLQLIDTPVPNPAMPDTPRARGDQTIFQKDPILREYPDCFSDKPGTLPNKVHLEVDASVPPVVHPPRKIPVAMLEPAREKLKEMEEDGIIVKEDEPTSWVSSMLVIDKRKVKDKRKDTPLSKDDVRICIDPRDLNKALKRPHYPMVTVEEVANRLSGAKSFTSLDACSGYWQLPVDEESSKLLTFNTHDTDLQDSLLVSHQPLKSTKGRWTDCLKGFLLKS